MFKVCLAPSVWSKVKLFIEQNYITKRNITQKKKNQQIINEVPVVKPIGNNLVINHAKSTSIVQPGGIMKLKNKMK